MRPLLLCPFLAFVLPSIAEGQSTLQDAQACEAAARSFGVGASAEALSSALRPPSQSNLLGNGGFETWSQGTNPGPFGGPLAPDLWVPMGDSSGTFDQTSLLIERSPALGGSVGPPWDAELTSIEVGSFVSQTMENGGEFRGLWLTFSVDIRTTSAAQPTIEIDDGISQSSSSDLVLASPGATRFTVRHQVAATAKQVVFRIYPDQVIEVDNAMAIVGLYPSADFVPRPNPEPGLMELPLGAVIDWYRFAPSIPVPEGFAICDGSLVADAASPFFGMNTLDLADKFVRGVTTVGQIGQSGGSTSANLNHTHGMAHTHSGTTGAPAGHILDDIWIADGGIGEAGDQHHFHNFTTGGPSISQTGAALSTVSILPPYVGLLKIMRVK